MNTRNADNNELKPELVFLSLIPQAIDQSLEILVEAGVDDDTLWSAMQTSLAYVSECAKVLDEPDLAAA